MSAYSADLLTELDPLSRWSAFVVLGLIGTVLAGTTISSGSLTTTPGTVVTVMFLGLAAVGFDGAYIESAALDERGER